MDRQQPTSTEGGSNEPLARRGPSETEGPPSSSPATSTEAPPLPAVGLERPGQRITAPPTAAGVQQQQQMGGFAGVTLRPPGNRYGDADLVPGGSLDGGMYVDGRGVRRTVGDPADPFRAPQGSDFDDHIRFDPMHPGQPRPNYGFPGAAPRGGGFGPGPGRTFPGEPDPDHFLPFQGGPNQPFGGPGGGQFGPRGFGGGGSGPGGFC